LPAAPHTRRAVQHLRAERARERRLQLRRLELDQAGDARGAAVVHQAERVHRAIRLAHAEHGLGQRVEIMRLAELLCDFRLHVPDDAIART
jgi:hypothetical protein